MASREFTGRSSVFSGGCDHKALRCSGSGPREVDSFNGGTLNDDLDHGDVWCVDGNGDPLGCDSQRM
jgi:hypothetical protein